MDRSSIGITERYPAQLIVPIVDILAMVVGALLAYWCRFGTFELHERYWLATAIMALLVVLFNVMQRSYARWRITRITTLLARLCLVWMVVAIMAASLIYFAHAAERFSRLWVGGALLTSFAISASARVAAQIVLRRARRFGRARRSVFLVGPSEQLLQVGKGMLNAPAEGYSIAGVSRLAGELGTKPAACVQPGQLLPVVFADLALAVGAAVDLLVVDHHHFFILGQLDVDFHPFQPQLMGLFQAGQGIFRGQAGHASVSAQDHRNVLLNGSLAEGRASP